MESQAKWCWKALQKSHVPPVQWRGQMWLLRALPCWVPRMGNSQCFGATCSTAAQSYFNFIYFSLCAQSLILLSSTGEPDFIFSETCLLVGVSCSEVLPKWAEAATLPLRLRSIAAASAPEHPGSPVPHAPNPQLVSLLYAVLSSQDRIFTFELEEFHTVPITPFPRKDQPRSSNQKTVLLVSLWSLPFSVFCRLDVDIKQERSLGSCDLPGSWPPGIKTMNLYFSSEITSFCT